MKAVFSAAIAVLIIFIVFQKSDAEHKHVIVTGKPGSGKTSSVYKIIELLKKENIPYDGFTTAEIKKGLSRVGFEVINLKTKEKLQFAYLSYIHSKPGTKIGQFIIDTNAFESIVKPIFTNWATYTARILIMDEIGKMETCSPYFCQLLRDLFKSTSHIILATAASSRTAMHNVFENSTEEVNIFYSPVWRENRTSTPLDLGDKIINMYREMITKLD